MLKAEVRIRIYMDIAILGLCRIRAVEKET
jgi:hypothetical protein